MHLNGYSTLCSGTVCRIAVRYDGYCCNGAAHPSGEPTADAELQRPAAAALANLCSDPSLAQQLVENGGMSALVELANSPDREVQVRSLLPVIDRRNPCSHARWRDKEVVVSLLLHCCVHSLQQFILSCCPKEQYVARRHQHVETVMLPLFVATLLDSGYHRGFQQERGMMSGIAEAHSEGVLAPGVHGGASRGGISAEREPGRAAAAGRTRGQAGRPHGAPGPASPLRRPLGALHAPQISLEETQVVGGKSRAANHGILV